MINSPSCGTLRRPLVFGEVLFDVFEDGTEVLGGAPFNVAYHLHGFGLHPLMISRVGSDSRGREVRRRLEAEGMDVSGIQVDPDHETGVVQVSLKAGVPRFRISEAAAWDFIDWAEVEAALASGEEPGIICCGTLALRAPASRRSLFQTLERYPERLLVDLNLRDPWWTGELVDLLIDRSRWIKLNEHELARIQIGRASKPDDLREVGSRLCRELGKELLAVTLGAQGAVIADASGVHVSSGRSDVRLVDTVGAGDAFTAVLMRGLLRGEEPDSMLRQGIDFSGRICGIRGAIPDSRSFYDSCL